MVKERISSMAFLSVKEIFVFKLIACYLSIYHVSI